MNYYLQKIEEHNGEQEYRQYLLFINKRKLTQKQINKVEEDNLIMWYGKGSCTYVEDGRYEYMYGQLVCEGLGVEELTEEEYNVLSKYI